MVCTHSKNCPLYPRLQQSLQGWKDAFCDSDTGSKACARFQLSLTGQPVPLGLMPNGKLVSVLTEATKPVEEVDVEVREAVERLGLVTRIRSFFGFRSSEKRGNQP